MFFFLFSTFFFRQHVNFKKKLINSNNQNFTHRKTKFDAVGWDRIPPQTFFSGIFCVSFFEIDFFFVCVCVCLNAQLPIFFSLIFSKPLAIKEPPTYAIRADRISLQKRGSFFPPYILMLMIHCPQQQKHQIWSLFFFVSLIIFFSFLFFSQIDIKLCTLCVIFFPNNKNFFCFFFTVTQNYTTHTNRRIR